MRYFPDKPPDFFSTTPFERRLRLLVILTSLVLLASAAFLVWMYG